MSRIASFVLAVSLVVLVAGCGASKKEVESSIRNEIKNSMGVEITDVKLDKQSDGGYTGTATAANGDVYDVVVDPPKGGRTEWRAAPSQSMVEKNIKTDLDARSPDKVKSVELTKQALGSFNGKVTLQSGMKLKVSTVLEDKMVKAKYEPLVE